MWYSLKFSTAMNRLQTGWVILMAASTTKRGPLRFSLVFFSQTGFTSNFIQQGVATVATFALSFSQHSCRDSFGRRSAKCSWPAGVANARRVPRWNSFFLCLSVLLFEVQESTVISKFIYIYIYLVRSHLRCGNNAGLLLWKQKHVESYPAIIPFHAFYNVEVVRSWPWNRERLWSWSAGQSYQHKCLDNQSYGFDGLLLLSVLSPNHQPLALEQPGMPGGEWINHFLLVASLDLLHILVQPPLSHLPMWSYVYILSLFYWFYCLSWGSIILSLSIIVYHDISLSICHYLWVSISINFPYVTIYAYLCLCTCIIVCHYLWLTMIIYYWSFLPIIKYHVYHVLAVSIISLHIIIYYPSLPSLS